MKFPKEVPVVVGLGQWAILLHFAPAAASQACIFFNCSCRLHAIISRQMKGKAFVIFKSFQRVLYCSPNFFKYFKLGQNTPSISRVQQASEIMIVSKYFFLKRIRIKFCIWESNRFFSVHWESPLKIGQSQNRGYESEKMPLKLEKRKF